MATTPTIRTGRRTTFLVSLMSVLILTTLGVSQLLGIAPSLSTSIVVSLAILTGSLALLFEIFYEGASTGLMNRDYGVLEIFGAFAALGMLVMSASGLLGSLVGTPVASVPGSVEGVMLLLTAVLLGQELFSE